MSVGPGQRRLLSAEAQGGGHVRWHLMVHYFARRPCRSFTGPSDSAIPCRLLGQRADRWHLLLDKLSTQTVGNRWSSPTETLPDKMSGRANEASSSLSIIP